MSEPGAWFLVLSGLSFLPFLVVSVTPFLRFVIVFSAIRYALGLQQTPPNIVIILADDMGACDLGPFVAGTVRIEAAYASASDLLNGWLTSRVDPEALGRLYQIAGQEVPAATDGVGLRFVIPAFMLSELAFAFKAAFFVMVPFLLVDLAVASILMSLGIIMLPPITVSLPIKVMLFVLVDGWTLIGVTVAESALS